MWGFALSAPAQAHLIEPIRVPPRDDAPSRFLVEPPAALSLSAWVSPPFTGVNADMGVWATQVSFRVDTPSRLSFENDAERDRRPVQTPIPLTTETADLPEPPTTGLLALGLAALICFGRKRGYY